MALWNQLRTYNKKVYPMHMPGHKGGRYKLIDHLYEIDVTEVPDTDHLYNPEGILRESLDRLSEFYGSRKSIYLVNGSTVGILSAIGGVTQENDEILVARNCHHSVYNALELYKLHPRYIYPKMSQWGLVGGIDPEELAKLLSENPKIVTFVMTSPTYDGFISDISSIQRICTRYNVVLIVDEAHGAHLPMSQQLPKSAIELGADIVIHSMHKTLPTLTGSGLLHLNVPNYLEDKILHQLEILQTSSPSYVMMAQMDACVEQLGHKEVLWKRLLDDISYVENKSRKLKKLYMISDYSNMDEGIMAKDPLKNLLVVRGTNLSGQALANRLRDKHNFQLEMASELHALAIFTIADSKKALNTYLTAIKKEDRSCSKVANQQRTYLIKKSLKQMLTPYETSRKASKFSTLEDARGKVISQMITPYPPGIPVIVAGEIISREIIDQIQEWQDIGISITGIEEGKVSIVEEGL